MASVVGGAVGRRNGVGEQRVVHIAIDCIVCVLLVLYHDRFASRMECAPPLMWCLALNTMSSADTLVYKIQLLRSLFSHLGVWVAL